MITIISDIDGVLVALNDAVYQSYRQAFAIQNQKFTSAAFSLYLVNQPWRPDVFKTLYPTVNLDKLRKDKQRIYKTQSIIINKPLITFFLCLKTQGNELLLVTGGSKEATNHKLANVNLKADKVFCSCQKHSKKFWQAIMCEAKNPNIWLFDDDEKVYDAVRGLGINVIQYNFKGNQNAG